MSYKDYVLLCIGHARKKIEQKNFERDLKYFIIKGWATKKLPPKEVLFPIQGEVIPKPKKLTKREVDKVKAFNDYVLSGKWRKKQNG